MPLRDMAATDRQVLLICILLAFVFWLILNLSQEYRVDREVVLTYQTGPERVMAGNPPRRVPVQLVGSGWNLIWESLSSSTVEVIIDLTETKELLLSSSLLQQQVARNLSSGDFTVENMGYESLTVYTTPRDGKRVPVIPHVRATFKPGYFSPNGVVLTPDSVTLSGAGDVLDTIDSWPMQAIELEGLESDRVFLAPLERPGEVLTLNYDDVRVNLEVEAFIEQQLQVPISIRNAPVSDSFRIFPSTVTLTLTIPQRNFGQYRPSDFRVEADIDQLRAVTGNNTVPLRMIRVPESIKSVTYTPRAVEYYVYRRAE
jgi:YbbR domain-containing protein